MSHLRLGGRQLTVATGDQPEYEAAPRPLAWAALRVAHASSLEEPLGSVLVRLFNEARTAFMK